MPIRNWGKVYGEMAIMYPSCSHGTLKVFLLMGGSNSEEAELLFKLFCYSA